MKKSNRLASLESWHNGNTPLSPLEVAEAFARDNLSTYYRGAAEAVIALFHDDPKLALSVAHQVRRHEFVSPLDYLAWAQFVALFGKSTQGGTEQARKCAARSTFCSCREPLCSCE